MPQQTLFPLADTVERYLAIRGDDARLRLAVTALCDHLGLRAVDIVRFGDCSLPVYAVDDTRVLKLYPGAFEHGYQTERRVLEAIEGRLPVPTPRLEHAGEFDGWGYLLMERLRGQPLTSAWPRASAQRRRLAAQLGEALAALHAISAPELDALGPADWSGVSGPPACRVCPTPARSQPRQRLAGADPGVC